MATHSSEATPALACVPDAIPQAERAGHFALAQRLLTKQARERADLPDGYAFRFAAEDFAAIAQFVANERKCCPFVRFEVTVGEAAGPVWLRMTGAPGTREVLRAELEAASGCEC